MQNILTPKMISFEMACLYGDPLHHIQLLSDLDQAIWQEGFCHSNSIRVKKPLLNEATIDIMPCYVCHIQTVECARIYAISERPLRDIALQDLFTMIQKGKFKFGVTYINNSNIITAINDFQHEDNTEILLHYTQPRSFPGNVAWRSIHWDLFADFI